MSLHKLNVHTSQWPKTWFDATWHYSKIHTFCIYSNFTSQLLFDKFNFNFSRSRFPRHLSVLETYTGENLLPVSMLKIFVFYLFDCMHAIFGFKLREHVLLESNSYIVTLFRPIKCSIKFDSPLYILRGEGYNFHKLMHFFLWRSILSGQNSENPGEMLLYATFHLGLHCLPYYLFMGFRSFKG